MTFTPFFQAYASKRGSYRSSYTQQDLTDAYNAVFEEKIQLKELLNVLESLLTLSKIEIQEK